MDFAPVADLARQQHSVLTLGELAELKVKPGTVRDWVKTGRLERLHQGVFGIGGVPRTFERLLYAAVRAGGPHAMASHRAAGVLWELCDEGPVEITLPYEHRTRIQGVIVHRSKDIHRATRHRRNGIPVTSPMRAVVDAGAVLTRPEVEDMLDTGLSRRLFTLAAVEWAYTDVARPGRNGGGVIRRILETRALGADRPDSLLEPRMARIFIRYGLPLAVFQHPVVVDGCHYRIDFAYPARMIAIEVDGWQKFATPESTRQALARQNALILAGWRVIRFTWHDVVCNPARVAADLRAALGL